MGTLARFKLDKFVNQFKLKSFFETGSFKGDGIQVAVNAGFQEIISTEIMDEFYNLCRERFKANTNVNIVKGNSFDLVPQLLTNTDQPTFYWLDAHFPGADGGILGYNDEKIEEVKYPLEKEIEQILAVKKQIANDVFLIDDLRIYEDGNFDHGNMPDNIARPKNRNIDFVYKLLGNTHNIIRLYNDEGYILCVPKHSEFNESDFVNPSKKKKSIKRFLKKLIGMN